MNRRLAIVVLTVLAVACSSSGGGSSRGTGGATATGGISASGGDSGTGGRTGTGGTPGTGGVSTGGRSGTGGGVSTGGRSGTGGAVATGGSFATGGASDAGSPPATGGTGGKDAAVDRPGDGAGAMDVPISGDVADIGAARDLSAEAAALDAGARLRVAIPLYIYPGDDSEWAVVATAGSAVSYIIANAGDPGGPGPSADPAYATAIGVAHKAGQMVLGYVDTSFAARALADAQAEINQWYAFYSQLDGIFLDQTPDSATSIASYYKPLSDQIRAKPGAHVVVINPGQPDFAEGYMALADVAMSYENPYGSAGDGYAPGQYSAPAWMAKYPAERFWHVILEVADAAAMRNVLDLARARNVGHVYVTNYADPPAYARIPTYFTDEIAAVGR
jgi:hypothetical protein